MADHIEDTPSVDAPLQEGMERAYIAGVELTPELLGAYIQAPSYGSGCQCCGEYWMWAPCRCLEVYPGLGDLGDGIHG